MKMIICDLVMLQNLVRGRGLLCRSMMKSQMASPSFTPVYAALVAVGTTPLFCRLPPAALESMVSCIGSWSDDCLVCTNDLAFYNEQCTPAAHRC